MNLALWIVAGVLAAGFLESGGRKLVVSYEKLAKPGSGWPTDFTAGSIKAIGAVEVLGAVGLILPAVLNIAPVLVPLAAIGLATTMLGAIVMHVRRHERNIAVVPLMLLALAVFVAWGRFGPAPFS
ncbi:MAG: DoxX family protein [Candidatus Dormibacteria bacterium]|jgi:uncharacterized membrane protein YphA (DoxX/SURF4 family)